MVRILKKGDKKPQKKKVTYKVYEVKCYRCGCVFEAERDEFRHECGLACIVCPQCGEFLDSYKWEYRKEKIKTKTISEW